MHVTARCFSLFDGFHQILHLPDVSPFTTIEAHRVGLEAQSDDSGLQALLQDACQSRPEIGGWVVAVNDDYVRLQPVNLPDGFGGVTFMSYDLKTRVLVEQVAYSLTEKHVLTE